ncbi:hypothetical protein JOB18_029744 [Solea senegalensis]|uniref:Uncharacterized protein n=1 Tax=Solea senegalensis TaxID=28829 RepID=A0AAV6RPM4_SOLSE|nr:hypothetical protein JOB18_029744 [Solea senegalensis]
MPPKVNKGGHTIQSHLRPVTRDAASCCGESTFPPRTTDTQSINMDSAALKSKLLLALREEVIAVFKVELQAALGENLSFMKTELLAFKSELSSSISAMQQDLAGLKGTVAGMEQSLSTCTDDIVQNKVQHLTQAVLKLEDKCEDLESRSRHQNIRIIGVPEEDSTSASAAGVSKLLMEVFELGKEPLVDRAHRALFPRPGPGGCPRTIVAWLHYYTEIQRIKIQDMTISISQELFKTSVCRRSVPALAPDWWLWFLPGLPPPIHLPASACLLSCTVIGSTGSSFTYQILPQLVYSHTC